VTYHEEREGSWSLTLLLGIGTVVLFERRFRGEPPLFECHAFEEVQVDGNCLFVQSFIIDPGFADPALGFLFQEHLEEVSQGLVADDLLDEFIVVFLALKQFGVGVDSLANLDAFDPHNLITFEVGQEGLAEVLGDVLGVAEMFGMFFLHELVLFEFFENVDLLILILFLRLVLVVRVVGGSSVLGLSRRQLRRPGGQVDGVIVLDRVFLVLVDNLGHLLDGVPLHFAEMVLDFQFGRVFFWCQGQVEVVLVVPIKATERKLFLSQYLFG
jgi:hypothetical protein